MDESHIFHLSPASAAVDEREAAAAQYMPSRADVLAARLGRTDQVRKYGSAGSPKPLIGSHRSRV